MWGRRGKTGNHNQQSKGRITLLPPPSASNSNFHHNFGRVPAYNKSQTIHNMPMMTHSSNTPQNTTFMPLASNQFSQNAPQSARIMQPTSNWDQMTTEPATQSVPMNPSFNSPLFLLTTPPPYSMAPQPFNAWSQAPAGNVSRYIAPSLDHYYSAQCVQRPILTPSRFPHEVCPPGYPIAPGSCPPLHVIVHSSTNLAPVGCPFKNVTPSHQVDPALTGHIKSKFNAWRRKRNSVKGKSSDLIKLLSLPPPPPPPPNDPPPPPPPPSALPPLPPDKLECLPPPPFSSAQSKCPIFSKILTDKPGTFVTPPFPEHTNTPQSVGSETLPSKSESLTEPVKSESITETVKSENLSLVTKSDINVPSLDKPEDPPNQVRKEKEMYKGLGVGSLLSELRGGTLKVSEDNDRGKQFEKIGEERKEIDNPCTDKISKNNTRPEPGGTNNEQLKLVLANKVQKDVLANNVPGNIEESCVGKTDDDIIEDRNVELNTELENSTRNVPPVEDSCFVKPKIPERISPGVKKKQNKKKAQKRRPVSNMLSSSFVPVEKKARYSEPSPLFPAYGGRDESRVENKQSRFKASSATRNPEIFCEQAGGDFRCDVSSEEDFFTRRPKEDLNQDWRPGTVIDHASQRAASPPVFRPEVFEYSSRPLVRLEEASHKPAQEAAHTPAQEAAPASAQAPAQEGEEGEPNAGYSRRRLVGFC